MADAYWAALITIISGVVVFVVSEIVREIWLSPVQKYKSLKHDISYKLTYYANCYTDFIDLADKDTILIERYRVAADDLRCLACELRGFIETLSWFKPLIPSRTDLYKASAELIGLSNGFFCAYNTHNTSEHSRINREAAIRIKNLLRLEEYNKEV